jgi:hypothetical protein
MLCGPSVPSQCVTVTVPFLEFLPLVNAKAVSLLDHRRLLDQLLGLERRTSFGTGRDSVGHAPGAHDDVAVVAAGASLLALAKKPQIRVYAVHCGYGTPPGEPEREPPKIDRVTLSEKEALALGVRTAPKPYFRPIKRRRRFG